MSGPTTGTAVGAAAAPGSINTAVNSLMDLLGPEEDKPASDEATQDELKVAAKAAAEEKSETADEGETEAKAEDASEEAESEEEGEAEAAKPEAETYTVKVDGKEVKVTRDELLAGYSRTADYTRKTQAVANDRKTVEQELAQARQERAEYAALLPHIRKAVMGNEAEPNWDELKAKDPSTWLVKREEWREKSEKAAQIDAESARVAAAQKADNDKRLTQVLAEQRTKLIERMPEWADADVAKAQSKEIADWMLSQGFTKAELKVYDARALHMLWKAKEFDKLQAEAPAVKGKIAKAPVVKPGSGAPQPVSKVQSARNRLAKTGSMKDAASFFERML